MNAPKSARKVFVDPVVSEPIDALDATRSFGGLLGVPLGGGSNGTALDNPTDAYYSYGDSPGQDAGVDPYGPSV